MYIYIYIYLKCCIKYCSHWSLHLEQTLDPAEWPTHFILALVLAGRYWASHINDRKGRRLRPPEAAELGTWGRGSKHLSFISVCLFDATVIFRQLGNSFIIHRNHCWKSEAKSSDPEAGNTRCFVLNQTNRIKQIRTDSRWLPLGRSFNFLFPSLLCLDVEAGTGMSQRTGQGCASALQKHQGSKGLKLWWA